MIRRGAYILLVSGACLGTPAFADWVSVAVNRGDGAIGFSAVGADRKVTMKAAEAACQKKSVRNDGCFSVLSSEQCLSVAKAGVQVFARDRATVDEAEAAALELCRPVGGDKCKIVRTRCAK